VTVCLAREGDVAVPYRWRRVGAIRGVWNRERAFAAVGKLEDMKPATRTASGDEQRATNRFRANDFHLRSPCAARERRDRRLARVAPHAQVERLWARGHGDCSESAIVIGLKPPAAVDWDALNEPPAASRDGDIGAHGRNRKRQRGRDGGGCANAGGGADKRHRRYQSKSSSSTPGLTLHAHFNHSPHLKLWRLDTMLLRCPVLAQGLKWVAGRAAGSAVSATHK
jgi:hypothetical protein